MLLLENDFTSHSISSKALDGTEPWADLVAKSLPIGGVSNSRGSTTDVVRGRGHDALVALEGVRDRFRRLSDDLDFKALREAAPPCSPDLDGLAPMTVSVGGMDNVVARHVGDEACEDVRCCLDCYLPFHYDLLVGNCLWSLLPRREDRNATMRKSPHLTDTEAT